MLKLTSLSLLAFGTSLAFSQVNGQSGHWSTHGGNLQHWAQAPAPIQPLETILWQTPVDDFPQYSGTNLLTHYGSILITRNNTVIVPVKSAARDGLRVEGRNGLTGSLIWSFNSDYSLPSFNWIPSMSPSLTLYNSVAIPGAGGTIQLRLNADSATSTVNRLCFYGLSLYNNNKAWCDTNVKICTPITADARGNIYFGYRVTGTPPAGFPSGFASGIAKVTAGGTGIWKSAAATAGGDTNIITPVQQCAPAFSPDGSKLYMIVRGTGSRSSNYAKLVCLRATDLTSLGNARMWDPRFGTSFGGYALDDGTTSPMVGPDGEVFAGVWANNNYRGFMLKFGPLCQDRGIASSFGWDDTPSLVPASAVPSYTGTSKYLILTKYNNYGAGPTGDGKNRLAILDPNAKSADPVVGGLLTMTPVLTVLGVTPDPEFPTLPGAVKEWCVNSVSIDAPNKSAVVNCEDGYCYKWDFVTNTLTQPVQLTSGLGEAYTYTVSGPTGIAYFVNNAILFAVGKSTTSTS